MLGNIRLDGHGDHWLHLIGKGGKPGKVAVPPLAHTALDHYLAQRQLPVSPERWNPKTPLVGSLGEDGSAGITGAHLWRVLRRFFIQAADVIEADHPVAAEKLRRATPHWMRHSYASHALARGFAHGIEMDARQCGCPRTQSAWFLNSGTVARAGA